MLARIIYLTDQSKSMAKIIKEKCRNKISIFFSDVEFEIIDYKTFKSSDKKYFLESDFLLFIMASGIVVRSIANLLDNKLSDPAILVMDEKANNIISLLSGHIGGANYLCRKISHIMGSNPVITTSTDVNSKGAFDSIIRNLNADIDKINKDENFRDLSLQINSLLLKSEQIDLLIDREYYDILIKIDKNIFNGFNLIESLESSTSKILLYISESYNSKEKLESYIVKNKNKNVDNISEKILYIVPRLNVLGVGCRKNKESADFENILISYLKEMDINPNSISYIGSIDIKSREKCIIDFSKKYNIEKKFFTKEQISSVDYKYEKSDFVKNTVGVYSVAQPVCDLLSNSNIIGNNIKTNGVSFCLGRIK
ncbi:cobalt-precorrin 5A hydrolase [Peptostreptococcus equinus]|uniref:Cobalamin biosynthesis protein n=1 Tax=Peptostreptococcus equinus TaxID=3003601 RepID=A0ABY7JP07_9FIRM|nr:cobalamin biosynthesis protein [Peptostreptococcus sp. CBA3647]WAW15099.1 cobalamin biosynthesis protein [Peptostreptococcus sp. CBA3647]